MHCRGIKNTISKEIDCLKISGEDASRMIANTWNENKELIAKKDAEVQEAKEKRDCIIAKIGNLVHDTVPVSNDEENNAIIRSWGDKRTDAKLKNHVELVEFLGIADLKKGANAAGGYYLTGAGVQLNYALINFALSFLEDGLYFIATSILYEKRYYGQVCSIGTVR